MKTTTALLTGASAALVIALAGCSSDATDVAGAPTAAATTSTTSAAPPLAASEAPVSAPTSAEAPAPAGTTPITITAGDVTVTAVLNDSDVSQDLIDLLPLTTPASRNASIEYIAELPGALTETGPFYTDVRAGDLVYYNPADTVTIIYAPTSSVPTLTKMGEVTSDLELFESLPDNVEMRFELG
jgi:hypothetical protein